MTLKTLVKLPMSEIDADMEWNCRGQISPVDVVDLARDIESRGLIQPITVCLSGNEDKKYRLIAGFRRFIAHTVIRWKEVDCILINRIIPEAEARFMNLSENIQRHDLNLLQEALALQKLRTIGVTETEAAERLNKSRGWIQIRYMLLTLPEAVQHEVAAGFVNQTHVRELYSIYNLNGLDSCLMATRKIKDAKILGKKVISVNPRLHNPKVKMRRSRGQIFEMINTLFEQVEPGIWSRALSWAAGEISTEEFFDSVEEALKTQGKQFNRPNP